MIRRLLNLIKGNNFKSIDSEFISKDELFTLIFPKNWKYSRSQNSYYYFANEELKGGFEISLIWKRKINDQINDSIEYANFLIGVHFALEDFESVSLSGRNMLKKKYSYEDSNLEFTSWVLKCDELLLHIRFMILEDESIKIQEKWLSEVNQILSTLQIDFKNQTFI